MNYLLVLSAYIKFSSGHKKQSFDFYIQNVFNLGPN